MKRVWIVAVLVLIGVVWFGMQQAWVQEKRDKPSPKKAPQEWGEGEPRFGKERFKPLSEEEIAEVLKWIEEFDPGRLKKLERLKSEEPEIYMHHLNECRMEMLMLKKLEKEDPEAYNRILNERRGEAECFELADKYRNAKNDNEKKTYRDTISKKLSELFDLRQAAREEEVRRLEEQLARMKESLNKRKANKALIIEQRLAELLGEKEDMGW